MKTLTLSSIKHFQGNSKQIHTPINKKIMRVFTFKFVGAEPSFTSI